MSKLNLIIILIDGGRLDYVQDSKFYNKLKEKFSFISNSVTYAPHTIASMHAVFSGCYGNRTGTNSYWSTFKFQKENFKSLTEYLEHPIHRKAKKDVLVPLVSKIIVYDF